MVFTVGVAVNVCFFVICIVLFAFGLLICLFLDSAPLDLFVFCVMLIVGGCMWVLLLVGLGCDFLLFCFVCCLFGALLPDGSHCVVLLC